MIISINGGKTMSDLLGTFIKNSIRVPIFLGLFKIGLTFSLVLFQCLGLDKSEREQLVL